VIRVTVVRVAVAALAIAVLLTRALSSSPSTARSQVDPRAQTVVAARAFLDHYVTADGRVVRRDQGGDTVSEGQAYAMLLAVTARDRPRFQRVWSWTVANLQRPDGLLAWHWADGHVVDAMPATDADLDAARALVAAADAFGMPSYRSDGNRIAGAILAGETVDVGGRPVLVAGPWARGAPDAPVAAIVNPSYFSPRSYAALTRSTGDARWGLLAATARDEAAQLTQASLPPDWATIDRSGVARPTGLGSGTPGYGADAARFPVRFAEACDAPSRALSAALWPRLHYEAHRSTIGYLGAAGAAGAAGQLQARDQLLERAADSERQHSTYYGAAWVALARAMLTTDLFGSCGA
jgi:endo-1,4-beta-D-glucanase Y